MVDYEEGSVDELIDFELEEDISFIVEIDKNAHIVYITENNSSGCNYNYESKDDIIDAVKTYINNYVEDRI